MTAAAPRVSVVVPTFNRRDLLGECLEALARQTQRSSDFEVVVVVDGSRDGTSEMLARHPSPYRLVTVEQENTGQACARNRGAKEASAPYLLFLDDDVRAEPDLIAEHVRVQEQEDGVVGVGRLTLSVPEGADGLSRWLRFWWERHYDALASERNRPSFRDAYSGNLSLPTDAFRRVGGFSPDFPRMMNDVELGYRLAADGLRLVYVPEAVGAQTHSRGFVELAREIEMRGAATLALAEKHPAAGAELPLSGFRKASLVEIVARRVLLFIGPPLQVLAMFDPILKRLPGADRIYGVLHSYLYWRGVRRVAGADRWRALTRAR